MGRSFEDGLAEPFLYLNTSVTDPAHREMRSGTLMAWWAVDRAAWQGLGDGDVEPAPVDQARLSR